MTRYFRPGRKDLRAAISKAMPKMLADGKQRSVKDDMREIVEGITARRWMRDNVRLMEVLNSLG